MAAKDGYALEHRKVLYDSGAEVPKGSHVHHLNGDRLDNNLENLVVIAPRAHTMTHIEERGGVRNQHGFHPALYPRPCERCGQEFKPWKRSGRFCSRICANRRGRANHGENR